MNDAICGFQTSDADISETEKYYDLYTITRDCDIASIIISWDGFLTFQQNPIIKDRNGRELLLYGKNLGENSGIYKLKGYEKYHDRIITTEVIELTGPSPKNVKTKPQTTKIQILNTYQQKITVDGHPLKNKTVIVMDSCVTHEIEEIFRNEGNKLCPKRIYIQKFSSVYPSLMGLFLWDKVNITKLKPVEAIKSAKNKNILDILKTYSDRELYEIYDTTTERIENVFSILEKS